MKKQKAFTINFGKIVFDIITKISVANQCNISKEFAAVWDTGAQGSVITKKVAKTLKLTHIGWTTVRGVTGEARAKIYFVDFILPNGVQIQTEVTSCDSLGNSDALIGMDIITLGDFLISNYGKKTVFSFRIPPNKTYMSAPALQSTSNTTPQTDNRCVHADYDVEADCGKDASTSAV